MSKKNGVYRTYLYGSKIPKPLNWFHMTPQQRHESGWFETCIQIIGAGDWKDQNMLKRAARAGLEGPVTIRKVNLKGDLIYVMSYRTTEVSA